MSFLPFLLLKPLSGLVNFFIRDEQLSSSIVFCLYVGWVTACFGSIILYNWLWRDKIGQQASKTAYGLLLVLVISAVGFLFLANFWAGLFEMCVMFFIWFTVSNVVKNQRQGQKGKLPKLSRLEGNLRGLYLIGRYDSINQILQNELPHWEMSKYLREAVLQVIQLKKNIKVAHKQGVSKSVLVQLEEITNKAAQLLWSVAGTIAAYKNTGFMPTELKYTIRSYETTTPSNSDILAQQTRLIIELSNKARESNDAILVMALSKTLSSPDAYKVQNHIQALNSAVAELYAVS